MVPVGVVALAVGARYVWRASAVVRASDADSLDGVADGSLVRVGGETRRGDADPLVVSDRPPVATLLRMTRTSVAGLGVGLGGLLLGAFLLA